MYLFCDWGPCRLQSMAHHSTARLQIIILPLALLAEYPYHLFHPTKPLSNWHCSTVMTSYLVVGSILLEKPTSFYYYIVTSFHPSVYCNNLLLQRHISQTSNSQTSFRANLVSIAMAIPWRCGSTAAHRDCLPFPSRDNFILVKNFYSRDAIMSTLNPRSNYPRLMTKERKSHPC